MDTSQKNLTLYFIGGNEPELDCIEFRHPTGSEIRRAVRGRPFFDLQNEATFAWTASVRALALFLVQVRINALSSGEKHSGTVLRGEARTPAASLDYVLARQSNWLKDLFGFDRFGNAFARRFILRQNPERKRKGPVTLSLNTRVLPPETIHILLDDVPCDSVVVLEEVAEYLASYWNSDRRPAIQLALQVAA